MSTNTTHTGRPLYSSKSEAYAEAEARGWIITGTDEATYPKDGEVLHLRAWGFGWAWFTPEGL